MKINNLTRKKTTIERVVLVFISLLVITQLAGIVWLTTDLVYSAMMVMWESL